MKFDITKNKTLLVLIIVGLLVLLIALSVWKQMYQKDIQEGMIVMDFTTSNDPNMGNKLSDMDLQGYINALIPFERKFTNAESIQTALTPYFDSYTYDPSGNVGADGDDIRLDGITEPVLNNFIEHLKKTSKAFQQFSEGLVKMREQKKNDYLVAEQNRIAAAKTAERDRFSRY